MAEIVGMGKRNIKVFIFYSEGYQKSFYNRQWQYSNKRLSEEDIYKKKKNTGSCFSIKARLIFFA